MTMLFSSQENVLLVKLLIAHFMADFILQTRKSVQDKEANGVGSYAFGIHIILIAFTAYLAYGSLLSAGLWLITLSHAVIDAVKINLSRRQNKHHLFIADQTLHIAIIVLVWACGIQNGLSRLLSAFAEITCNYKTSLWALGYVIVIGPATIIIRMLTEKWTKDVITTNDGLKDAGKWIGILERVLIITFIYAQQYLAIGLLITAKSILRLADNSSTTKPLRTNKFSPRKHTEYVLIGTFLSFGISIITGFIIQWLASKN